MIKSTFHELLYPSVINFVVPKIERFQVAPAVANQILGAHPTDSAVIEMQTLKRMPLASRNDSNPLIFNAVFVQHYLLQLAPATFAEVFHIVFPQLILVEIESPEVGQVGLGQSPDSLFGDVAASQLHVFYFVGSPHVTGKIL